MARYVNADKLLEYLEKEAESEDVKYSFIGAGVQATINEIKKFPLEDVKPVIHAHWETTKLTSKWIFVCSHCHDGWYERYEDDNIIWKYCPDCGAKMDEEVDNA